MCVPNDNDLKREILEEAHHSTYIVHPGNTEMYHDLERYYWWSGMNREVAEFVARCLTCQQVKVEHQRSVVFLQPLEILEWKWEHIFMDFVMGLSKTSKGFDAIWVIVDRLTKYAHFLPIQVTYSLD